MTATPTPAPLVQKATLPPTETTPADAPALELNALAAVTRVTGEIGFVRACVRKHAAGGLFDKTMASRLSHTSRQTLRGGAAPDLCQALGQHEGLPWSSLIAVLLDRNAQRENQARTALAEIEAATGALMRGDWRVADPSAVNLLSEIAPDSERATMALACYREAKDSFPAVKPHEVQGRR